MTDQCKAWCTGLVSAILVLDANKEKPKYALIAAIPVLLFMMMGLRRDRGYRHSSLSWSVAI